MARVAELRRLLAIVVLPRHEVFEVPVVRRGEEALPGENSRVRNGLVPGKVRRED